MFSVFSLGLLCFVFGPFSNYLVATAKRHGLASLKELAIPAFRVVTFTWGEKLGTHNVWMRAWGSIDLIWGTGSLGWFFDADPVSSYGAFEVRTMSKPNLDE